MSTEIRGDLISLGTPSAGEDAGRPRAVIYSTEELIRACERNLFAGPVAIVSAAELDALRDDKARIDWMVRNCLTAATALEEYANIESTDVRETLDAAMKGTL